MARKVTQQDVADLACVSRGLVSMALHDSPKIRPETKKRVAEAAAKLGYRPNAAAAMLASSKSGLVGLILPNLSNNFFDSVVSGVREVAKDSGKLVLVSDSGTDVATEVFAAWKFVDLSVDALILVSPLMAKAQLIELGKHVPVVVVGRTSPDPCVPAVYADPVPIMRQIVSHLVKAGWEHLIYINYSEGAGELGARDRRDAFLASVKASSQVTYELAVVSHSGVGHLLDGKLASHQKVAFVAHNDMLALAILSGLTVRGKRVGQDVGLVGYDNIPMAAAPEINLTTVDQKGASLGCLALMRALGGRREQQIVKAGELVVRASSGGENPKKSK
ncbi:hypothetical protein HMPREF3152_07245 [Actinomyces sp. HMSC06A08]|nr:LacI family DNA-binding transcriptional regulator [Winkia neuii]MDK8100103.1 LacI family DNA-binding transcriptional regulator [Winkia neuii]OFT54985.1 hypothetical protein HMPREF3152_07245 [Actinomyces sp. HMSC06A08]